MASEKTLELVRAVAPAAIAAIGNAVNANKKFNVKSITVCNLMATNQTVRLRIGTGAYVLYDYVLAPGTTLQLTGLISILAATEQFQAVTTTASGVQILVTGVEEDV